MPAISEDNAILLFLL